MEYAFNMFRIYLKSFYWYKENCSLYSFTDMYSAWVQLELETIRLIIHKGSLWDNSKIREKERFLFHEKLCASLVWTMKCVPPLSIVCT